MSAFNKGEVWVWPATGKEFTVQSVRLSGHEATLRPQGQKGEENWTYTGFTAAGYRLKGSA